MKLLNKEQCSKIYGGGIGFGEAVEGLIEGIINAAHGSEGVLSFAEALGVFESEEKVDKYTTDPDILKIDENIANTYLSELQHHNGSDKITDQQREDAIVVLQHDGRVFFNPENEKFEALGGSPQHGAYSSADIKDPFTHRELEYILKASLSDIHSTDLNKVAKGMEELKNGTREGAFHYDPNEGKFVVG
ncbi:hypothetical protein CEP45_07935 [Mergibacter septicus]|uniref:hypothetical protein n=1 Tax=Mergibacter septicus TaxID=221402 RepID=UPI001C77D784|nr:hypothetical protein [Mergibacter septicus]QDJ13770.1 hypothetical protein CEP45_07935 [Mergibacter septicus]